MQQPVPLFPARSPQRGLGRSRWSSHGMCVKGMRRGEFSPQFWGLGLWQTPKRHQTTFKHCATALLTIRSGFFRNTWYLDTHTLVEQALTNFTTNLEKTGRQFATCSIPSGLGSLHHSGPGSSLCYSFPIAHSDHHAIASTTNPLSPRQRPVPLEVAFGTQVSQG